MYNSTIIRREKICVGCGRPKLIFSKGRCKDCAGKYAAQSGSRIVTRVKAKDEDQEIWFQQQRLLMTGICINCGRPSCKYDDNYYKFSLAHILPKNKNEFPSVKTHYWNRLELCFWGEGSCHTNYDNKTLGLLDMNCFDTIITRFQLMYPDIAPAERRRIPAVLMNYVEIDL